MPEAVDTLGFIPDLKDEGLTMSLIFFGLKGSRPR